MTKLIRLTLIAIAALALHAPASAQHIRVNGFDPHLAVGTTCPPTAEPSGGGGSLYVCTDGSLYTWDGDEWAEAGGAGFSVPADWTWSNDRLISVTGSEGLIALRHQAETLDSVLTTFDNGASDRGLVNLMRLVGTGDATNFIVGTGDVLDAVENLAVTQQGTPGMTTYDYVVVAADAYGRWSAATIETTTTGNATLDDSNFNRLTWDAASGATQYYVFRGLTSPLLAVVTGGTTYDDTGTDLGGNRVPANGFTVSDAPWMRRLVIGEYDTENPSSSAGSVWIRGVGENFPGLLYTAHALIDSSDSSAELAFRINPEDSSDLPFNQVLTGLESSGYYYIAGPTNSGTEFQEILRVIPNLNVAIGGDMPELPGVQLRNDARLIANDVVVQDGTSIVPGLRVTSAPVGLYAGESSVDGLTGAAINMPVTPPPDATATIMLGAEGSVTDGVHEFYLTFRDQNNHRTTAFLIGSIEVTDNKEVELTDIPTSDSVGVNGSTLFVTKAGETGAANAHRVVNLSPGEDVYTFTVDDESLTDEAPPTQNEALLSGLLLTFTEWGLGDWETGYGPFIHAMTRIAPDTTFIDIAAPGGHVDISGDEFLHIHTSALSLQMNVIDSGLFDFYGGPIRLPDEARGTGNFTGRTVSVGRNSSGSGAAGCLMLEQADGTDRFLWVDATGDLRIGTACPDEDGTPSDTSGSVVGGQS